MKRLNVLKRNNKGITIIYLAITMLVLVGFVGLAVDIGYMYVAKGQLQNAADASALAAAPNLDGTNTVNQPKARDAAFTLASSNYVVPAKTVVRISHPTVSDSSGNTLSPTNDIVVGHWNGKFSFNNTSSVNAVLVRARRTSDSPGGQVSIFFGRILALLGANWGAMSTSAEAVAALVPAPILPIIVNEYWLGDFDHAKQKPYGTNQEYPNSFTRATNVDGTTSLVFGKTFAIMGQYANDNVPNNAAKGNKSMNGFVDLDARTPRHDGLGNSWFTVNTSALSPATCSNCMSIFTSSTPGLFALSMGDINSQKGTDSLGYLFNGYPLNFLPPSTVPEPVRPKPGAKKDPFLYPDETNIYNSLPYDPSNCPFATMAFFSGSGKDPLNKKSPTGQTFMESYPKGKKIVTMVYDGTFVPYADPSAPNAVTAVGYTLIQIDGYGNLINNISDFAKLDNTGSTLYGHALTDMIMPGDCSSASYNQIRQLQNLGATPQLVK